MTWDVDRINARLEAEGDCLIFKRCSQGSIKIHGKSISARRWYLEQYCGRSLKGWYVVSSCNNPLCFNREHLSIVSAKGKAADQKAKGHLNPFGGKIRSKLTLQQVKEIKASPLMEANWKLAHRYKVGRRTIEAIRKGRSWKSVTG